MFLISKEILDKLSVKCGQNFGKLVEILRKFRKFKKKNFSNSKNFKKILNKH